MACEKVRLAQVREALDAEQAARPDEPARSTPPPRIAQPPPVPVTTTRTAYCIRFSEYDINVQRWGNKDEILFTPDSRGARDAITEAQRMRRLTTSYRHVSMGELYGDVFRQLRVP